MRESVRSDLQGFGLIEIMVALVVLTFGLLAAGQFMVVSIGAGSLARSKGTAAVAAQDKLEYLSDLYRQTPNAMDLAPGSHGPQQIRVINPISESVLNYYSLDWTIAEVSDPRPGKALGAKLASVTVVPIHSDGSFNHKTRLNKALSITTIFSPRMP
jgi:prepilin-type N-terminal cleavage/methylation domain-containing protein